MRYLGDSQAMSMCTCSCVKIWLVIFIQGRSEGQWTCTYRVNNKTHDIQCTNHHRLFSGQCPHTFNWVTVNLIYTTHVSAACDSNVSQTHMRQKRIITLSWVSLCEIFKYASSKVVVTRISRGAVRSHLGLLPTHRDSYESKRPSHESHESFT